VRGRANDVQQRLRVASVEAVGDAAELVVNVLAEAANGERQIGQHRSLPSSVAEGNYWPQA
jgi:acid stress-induced BolA-like protein IbaG/YrbA